MRPLAWDEGAGARKGRGNASPFPPSPHHFPISILSTPSTPTLSLSPSLSPPPHHASSWMP